MGLFSGIKSYFGKSTDYFKQAKINQEDVVKDATNTVTSAIDTAQNSTIVAGEVLFGFFTYDYIAGKTMTAYSANALAGSVGITTPTIFSKIVNGAASVIFKHPAAALAGTIGACLFAAPEKAIKTIVNAGKTVYHAGEAVVDVTKCTLNIAVGLSVGAMEVTDYVTDYLFGNNSRETGLVQYNQTAASAKDAGSSDQNIFDFFVPYGVQYNPTAASVQDAGSSDQNIFDFFVHN